MITIEQITDITWDIKGIRFERAHRGIVWVNYKIKVAFLVIPKCGSTSVRNQWPKTKFSLDSTIDIQDVPEDFFLFTVIRDPIKRLISTYLSLFQDTSPNANHPGGRFRHDLEISPDQIKSLGHMAKNYDDCDCFVVYLNKLEEWGFFELHCVPQIVFLTDKDGVAFPNVQVFELDDLSPIERHIGTKFERHNQSKDPGLKQKLYEFIENNPDVKCRIKKFYEYDIALWQKCINT